MTSFYRDDLTGQAETGVVSRQLWAQSGLRPSDIDAAILYDHFSPLVLMQLEELGFCGRGEAPDFVKHGNLDMDGSLPTNTHGGQLGEAYLHGMNGVAEAVRQIRGTAVNQVAGASRVLVTGGSGPPTSGLILLAPNSLSASTERELSNGKFRHPASASFDRRRILGQFADLA